jgi:N-methylhydantoinase A
MGARLGVDTGGTFCDFVLVDDSGDVRRAKVPSTPADPALAIRAGLTQLGLGPASLSQVTVGTTIATNAVIERRGPRVIYIGNEGFTDVPFIGRLDKEQLYDLHWKKPPPMVRRRDCLGAPGRIDHHGQELDAIDADGLRHLREQLAAADAGAETVVAICLLFSYLNPDHEQQVRAAVAEALPEVAISSSHEVSPVWREYERASTTIADAFVKPVVADYVDRVGSELEDALASDGWNLLASNGGYLRAESAAARPAQLLISGLAGGVTGARHFAEHANLGSAFTLDMGGTSCDIGLIRDGAEQYAPEFDVAWGIPATIPCVSVKTIGAGGGSIAWIDRGGMLNVGPRSAGAEPGPVAYGRGGEEPTVTDANLVLGRLSPEYFLGGRMALDRQAAERAFGELGDNLGMTPREAASATLMIADEGMANAIRLVAVEHGLDPRDFALVAAGGAGPLHARSVASRLGIETVLVPPAPGLCSAFGALIAPPRVDRVQTYYASSENLDAARLFAVVGRLAEDAVADLRRSVEVSEPLVECYASLRYLGQNFELEVEIDGGPGGSWGALRAAFSREHERQYGFDLPGEPIEIVNLRATARRVEPPFVAEAPVEAPAPPSSRLVWLGGDDAVDCPVHRRSELSLGETLTGPAIVEETDSTTIAFAGDEILVDSSGSLLLTLAGSR